MGCTCSTTNIYVLQQNDDKVTYNKDGNFEFTSGDTRSFLRHLRYNRRPRIFWNYVNMKKMNKIKCNSPISFIRDKPNSGGYSQNSEYVSGLIFEHLLKNGKIGVSNVITENEIEYHHFYDGRKKIKDSRKTDYLCILDNGMKVAVEVKRIHINRYDLRQKRDRPVWPPEGMINCLLKANKKAGEANERVFDEYKWDYHMLHFMVNINDVDGFYEVMNDYIENNSKNIKNFNGIMISYIQSQDDWVFYDNAEIARFV